MCKAFPALYNETFAQNNLEDAEKICWPYNVDLSSFAWNMSRAAS